MRGGVVNQCIVNMHNCVSLANGKMLHGEDIRHCGNNYFFTMGATFLRFLEMCLR